MSDSDEPRIESPGPSEFHDPATRLEIRKATIWIGIAVGVFLIGILAQPILLILGGIVIATMLDGATRLLGRILPIPRWMRLAIAVITVLGFFGWTLYLTGSQLAEQFAALQSTIELQINRLSDWAASMGLVADADALRGLASQVLGSVGRVTSAVTTAIGTVASLVMMIVLGVFLAVEPRNYEQGLAWLLPLDKRERFYGTLDKMGWTLRRLMAGRLLGMAVEGVGSWILLAVGGVPMAGVLGLLTGLLAFLPNIGAIISGALIIMVGFSAGFDTGIYALIVYFAVQMIDGYLIVPMVAKRAVDLAPALVLGAQILLGTLFGILGLALADPIVAMVKVWLERRSEGTAEAKG